MPKTYNSNSNAPTNTTFSPVSFSNPASKICQSKLNIAYFNRVLKLGIALKNTRNSNDTYDTYDHENQLLVYISFAKARMLYELIESMKQDESIHNVCIELKNGLLQISDGSEFGVNSPCITIRSADASGNISSVTYETKANYHKGAYNYNEEKGTYSDKYFDTIELDMLETVLQEYYKASTYAIAATVMEASMYRHAGLNNKVHAIAEKVGAIDSNNNKNYNSKTFLGGGNNPNTQNISTETPKEYEVSSFDDIAKHMQ